LNKTSEEDDADASSMDTEESIVEMTPRSKSNAEIISFNFLRPIPVALLIDEMHLYSEIEPDKIIGSLVPFFFLRFGVILCNKVFDISSFFFTTATLFLSNFKDIISALDFERGVISTILSPYDTMQILNSSLRDQTIALRCQEKGILKPSRKRLNKNMF
jgi:hypothetical protein